MTVLIITYDSHKSRNFFQKNKKPYPSARLSLTYIFVLSNYTFLAKIKLPPTIKATAITHPSIPESKLFSFNSSPAVIPQNKDNSINTTETVI